MKTWKHLTFEQRKVISNGISQRYKLKEIGETLGFDPTSISKEVKRNRDTISIGLNKTDCKKINRWPYVCTGCNKKYNNKCYYTKYKYDPQKAQNKAETNLINSRKGIDIDSDKFKELDEIIKNGVDDKKSIYQITIENKEKIDKSVPTIYRYVNKGYLTTKRLDLPYAVTYKKRKHNKKYEYSENKEIDRTSHTYIDYLAYLHKNPGIYVWQLDFLGTIKSDNNNILSFILPNLQFVLLDLIKNPKGKSIDKYNKKDIQNINKTLLNRPLRSLDSYTPKDAFIRVFDEKLFNKLF